LKNRKNESKGLQSSSVSLGEPRRIAFLSDNIECRLAQLLFDTEARKMEIYWIASAGGLNSGALSNFDSNDVLSYSESLQKLGIENLAGLTEAPLSVTIEDLQKADLTVLIQKSGSSDSTDVLVNTFQSFKGEKEVWKLPVDEDAVDSLLQNVKSLLIRLILKGGKRAPVPLPAPPKNPEKTQGGGKSAVRVRLESKGRGGKKVTVVFGLDMEHSELENLATELKQSCGTGGTVKDDTIEIQGDQCERVLSELNRRGMKAKRSGG